MIVSASTSFGLNVGSPAAGVLLIVLVRFGGAPGTVSFPGYTQLASDSSDASDDQTMVFWRFSDGTEGATDAISCTNSVKCTSICWQITGSDHPLAQPPVISAVTIGTTTLNTANGASVAPPAAPQDTLYLSLMGIDGATRDPTVAPAGYSNLIAANSSTTGGSATNASVAGASKQALASSSDDPGVFTHPAANSGWTAWTVAIRQGVSQALTLPLADTVTPADALSPSSALSLDLTDNVGLADSLASQQDHGLSLGDSVTPSDGLTSTLVEVCLESAPIVGTFKVGDGTIVGKWARCVHRPLLTLLGRGFSITVTSGSTTSVSLGRSKLALLARPLTLALSSAPAVGRPTLILKGRALYVPPFVRMVFLRPTLVLRGRPSQVSLSAQLSFNRPRLLLQAHALVRVGSPALIPTIPEYVVLVPTTPQSGILVPTVAEDDAILTPSPVVVR